MGKTRRPAFKGCCGMCALQDGRVKGMGWAARMLPVERSLVGRSRRVSRGEVPADQLDPDFDLVWSPRVIDGRVSHWVDDDSEPVPPSFAPSDEHVPVNAAPTHDNYGWRTFGSPADVCRACSDFEAGRLVPVSFCPQALSALDAEEAELREWIERSCQ